MILALAWILDFLKPTLNSVASDRLRAKTSSEKARSRAYDLFAALTRLQQRSAELVDALESLAATAGADAPSRSAAGSRLHGVVWEVSQSLLDLASAMNRIDPQLSVHAPDLAQELVESMGVRSFVIDRVQDELRDLDRFDAAQLADIVADARASLAGITATTEDLRAFLESQFDFKDSL